MEGGGSAIERGCPSAPVAFPPVLLCCLNCRALAGGLLLAVRSLLFVLSFHIDLDNGTLKAGETVQQADEVPKTL